MTAKTGIEVDGLNRLVRQLRDLDPGLLDELKAVNARLAQDVERTARGLAPIDSGTLASSLRSSGTARSGIVRGGRRSVPYFGPIHFGWRKRNIRPNPFLYDALDRRRDDVYRQYLDAVQDVTGRVN